MGKCPSLKLNSGSYSNIINPPFICTSGVNHFWLILHKSETLVTSEFSLEKMVGSWKEDEDFLLSLPIGLGFFGNFLGPGFAAGKNFGVAAGEIICL